MDFDTEQPILHFLRYPPVGEDDWEYGFSTGRIRALESRLLSRASLLDMANAADFAQASEILSGTEYESAATANEAESESSLRRLRAELRHLCYNLLIDEKMAEVFRSRDDFANLKLAIRRIVSEKELGSEYSNEGNVPAEEFVTICEEENYAFFPEYMQDAVEEAVLRYYEEKDIREIDYAIDEVAAKYNLETAAELSSVFLTELFRLQIDLANIKTMLRVKWSQSGQRDVFLAGGYVETDRFRHGLDTGYEAVAAMFFATPYYEIVEEGVGYLVSDKSFLRLEALCDCHISGYLKTTGQLAAGPQPIIAYLLQKENEIRMVRMILAGKRNLLETGLLVDRLGREF